MSKTIGSWQSELLEGPLRLVAWGEIGAPVLVFGPSLDDPDELETRGVIDACSSLLAGGRIKLYAVGTTNAGWWLDGVHPLDSGRLQGQLNRVVVEEVVPAIWSDCSHRFEPLVIGIAHGAYHALESFLRRPDLFEGMLGVSGHYDLSRHLNGHLVDVISDWSPLHYIPTLSDPLLLDQLRSRFVLLATGTGAWERPGESWWLADVLESQSIPHRVDNWPGWPHDWETWRQMLPVYLDELVTASD